MSLSLNKKFYFSVSVFWFLLIFYLMIFYRFKSNNLPYQHLDKFIHFILFFIQSYLVTKTYLLRVKNVTFSILKVIIPFIIFIVLIEVVQIYIPYRSFDLFDLLMNIFGSVAGSIIGYFLSK
ncbi:MAG: VanZ family protein [Bacteroidota bacterium]|nr:VanZ family protein [Bacteroidota bacterium]